MEPITNDILTAMVKDGHETRRKAEAVRREALKSEIRGMIPQYDLNNLYGDLRLKLEMEIADNPATEYVYLRLDVGIYNRLEKLRDVRAVEYGGLNDAMDIFARMFLNLYEDWFKTYFPAGMLEFSTIDFGSVTLVIPLPRSSKVSVQT